MSLHDDTSSSRTRGPGTASFMVALRSRERSDFRKEPGVDLKVAAIVPRNAHGVPLDELEDGPPPNLFATVGPEGASGYAGINSTRRLHKFKPGQVLCVRAPKVGAKTPPRLYGVLLISSARPTLGSFWVDVGDLASFEIARDVHAAYIL